MPFWFRLPIKVSAADLILARCWTVPHRRWVSVTLPPRHNRLVKVTSVRGLEADACVFDIFLSHRHILIGGTT